MEKGWLSVIGLAGLVALLIKDGDKKANNLSGIKKRRSKRLFFMYDSKSIPREQVNEAKRLAKAGYGTLHATWAYSADEARGLIRQGKAETLGGLGETKPLFVRDITDNRKRIVRVVGWQGNNPIVVYPGKTGGMRTTGYGVNAMQIKEPYQYVLDSWQPIRPNESWNLKPGGGAAMELRVWNKDYLESLKPKDEPTPFTVIHDSRVLEPKTKMIPETKGQMTLFGGLGEYKKGDVVEYEGGLWEVAWVNKNDSRKYLRLQKGPAYYEKNIDRVNPEKVNPTNVTLEEHYQNEDDNIAINRANDRITGTLRRSKDDTSQEAMQYTQNSLIRAIQDLNDRQKKKYRYYLEANSPSAKIPLAIDDPKRIKEAMLELWIIQPKTIMANHGTSSAGKYDFTIIPRYQKEPEKTWEKAEKKIQEKAGQMTLFGQVKGRSGGFNQTEKSLIKCFQSSIKEHIRLNPKSNSAELYNLNPCEHYRIDIPRSITRSDLVELAYKIPNVLEISKDFGMPTIIQFNKGILDIQTSDAPYMKPSPISLHGISFPKSDSLPPILGWVGGKTKLADKIISMMPQHKVYVEPFLGGGSVFFRKPLADVNVINDLDIDLMNFYKGVRDGSCEKIRECKLPKNRKEFDKAVDNRGKDICSYLGVNKTSYGSIMVNPKPSTGKSSRNAIKVKDSCDRYKEKLKQAKMLNKDFKDVIKQYDSKDTLCYIDPHYVDANYYGHKEINPEDVAKLVKTMKGKAIVSYNNHPRVRKAFAGLNFHKVKTRYELQKSNTGTHRNVSELIITNF